MSNIIWIASYPKSGNTWLRSIVSSLLYTDSGDFNFSLLKKIQQFDKKINYEFIKKNKKDLINTIEKIESIAQYWTEAQKNIIKNNSQNTFNILKTHSANLAINNKNFTNEKLTAGVIYIIRDPREVVVSFSKHRGSPINNTIELISDNGSYFPSSEYLVPTLISSWNIHYESWQKSNFPKLFIKYEDLLSNTKKEVLKIKKFLYKIYKINFNNTNIKIDNIVKNTNFKKLQDFEKKNGFSEASKNSNFFRKAKINSWKKILSSSQVSKIEKRFEKTMNELKY